MEVLVNNAAHCETPDTVLEIRSGALNRNFVVNTRAAVLLTAELARRLRARGGTYGRVVNLSTDSAQTFAT